MNQTPSDTARPVKSRLIAGYEAPRVEAVLSSEQIEREAHYAGGTTQSG